MKIDSDALAGYGADMNTRLKPLSSKLGPDGRVLIPKELRDSLNLAPGAVIAMRIEDGRLVMTDSRSALRRLQESLKNIPTQSGLMHSEEFIQERHAEALLEGL